jgi:hypothetical protein
VEDFFKFFVAFSDYLNFKINGSTAAKYNFIANIFCLKIREMSFEIKQPVGVIEFCLERRVCVSGFMEFLLDLQWTISLFSVQNL